MPLISKYNLHVAERKIAFEDLESFLYTCMLRVTHFIPLRHVFKKANIKQVL
jgi:hypothetical protein